MPVFAMMIAPASRRFFASVASYGGTRFSNASAPPVVRRSVVWTLSFSAIGTPCGGRPRGLRGDGHQGEQQCKRQQQSSHRGDSTSVPTGHLRPCGSPDEQLLVRREGIVGHHPRPRVDDLCPVRWQRKWTVVEN